MTQRKVAWLCLSLIAAMTLSACSSGGSDDPAVDADPVLDVGDATVTEGDAGTVSLVFPVSLSESSTLDVSADWQLVDDTAVAGADYGFASGTVQIAAGQIAAAITAEVFGDSETEGVENFEVHVSNIVNADAGKTRGIGTIMDDDAVNPPPPPPPPLPALSVGDVQVAEGDAGSVSIDVPVTLSAPATQQVSLDYATFANSASEGTDYGASLGVLVIDVGQSQGIINVDVIGDTDIEGDETFRVVVGNVNGATITKNQAFVTIDDDDVPLPDLVISDASLVEGDAGGSSMTFTVSLSAAGAGDVTADYVTTDISATGGSDYTTTNGIVTIPAGQLSATIAIEIIGDTDVEGDESFNVTLSNPANATLIDAVADGTIFDDDVTVPPPLPTLSIAAAQIVEGDVGSQAIGVAVTLSAAATQQVSVDFATAANSATAGVDYVSASDTLIIGIGQSQGVINIDVIGDTDIENDETFRVVLSNPGGATILAGQAFVTIENDDFSPPDVVISDASWGEGNAGSSTLTFTVSMSATSGNDVTASYATSNGSATAGSDYASTNGGITIPAGQQDTTIDVTIFGDTADEPDETFDVTLTNPSNAVLVDATATGTINDDDPLPAMQIGDASRAEGDSGSSTLTFTVGLSAISGRDVTASYATSNGSASAGSDYTAASGNISIPAGQASTDIDITIFGDTTEESDETFSVTLTNPANATLADASATGTIDDDDTPVSASGLDTRPSNVSCIAPARPTGGGSITWSDAFASSPGFDGMTKILQAPGDASRWFVLEKSGRIKVFNVVSPNSVDTYLDFSSVVRTTSEGGMLGMAFDPNFPATPEVYVSYTINGSPMTSIISRIILDDTDDPVNTTEEVILRVDQPNNNHNGGDIAFGPDGYLYIGMGDGGGGGDPDETGQDTTRLLGSMLRIGVRGVHPTQAYTIPQDNPFVGNPPNPQCGPAVNGHNCPEIYAWGLRNPWRWSFDEQTGRLWLADVGQNLWEEVDIIELGGNYGWDNCEGLADYEANNCPDPAFVDPVLVYPHANSNVSITGGYVYRGPTLTALFGRYVFGDYQSRRIWVLADDGQGGYTREDLFRAPDNVSAFALGEDGELYFAGYSSGSGKIYKLVPDTGGPGNTIPDDLADTGCVDLVDNTQPAAGLIPFTINAPFWSDNAVKTRYLAVPDAGTIDIDAAEDFDFPPGSVIVKSFEVNNKLIETRLLMRHPDGVWAGYTYEWNDQETAATRVVGGKTKLIGGQTWIYPSDGACMVCHTSAAGFSLGPELAQLNGDLTYPSTGRTANQLATLEHIGMFSAPLADTPDNLGRLADPGDTGESLDARARAYLHTNCSQCHRPGGPTPSSMDLRYDTALSATGACDAVPQSIDYGIANARLIAPGESARSIIVERMSRRDATGMPPLGSAIADATGVTLIGAWINGLAGCGP